LPAPKKEEEALPPLPFLVKGITGLERSICGADERRWRGLDRATP